MSFKPANPPLWQSHFEGVEGRFRHFYLDGADNVTVGIGHKVTNRGSALPMVRKSTNIRTGLDDIGTDYDAVRALPAGKIESYYDRVCLLYLPDADIDALFLADMSAFTQQVEDSVCNLDGFPDLAALVLVDMAFNLGTHRLTADFPHFMNAFMAKDWKIAALECKRKERPEFPNGIQKERNDWARASLESLIQF